MNPLDLIILTIVVISIGAGVRRGFIIGVYDIAAAVLSLIFAAIAYGPIAGALGAAVDLQEPTLNLAGFILAYAIVALPGAILLRPAVRRFRSLTGIVPGANPLDRMLGIVPGAVQGILIAFVVVVAAAFFSASASPGRWLSESSFALKLYRNGTGQVLDVAGAAGFQPSEFFAYTHQTTGDSHVLPFREDPASLVVSVDDETRMLELVNAERSASGLATLEPDARLTAVARLHAIEMLEEGYFSHESPATGSPFDRLAASGVVYQLAGENLAFSPDVESAHDGLMNSPGHRANIMEPGYRRVGIGAIESESRGTMYVQMFTN